MPELNPTAAVIECVHHPLYLEDVFTGERKGLDLLRGKKVASLSGIAQPESFEQSLVKLGGELVYSKRFADHHRFTQQEILNAINRAKKRQADIIITTQKDAVRFPKIDRRDLPIYFMRVEIKIVSRRERLSGLRPQNLFPLMNTLIYWLARGVVALIQALPLTLVARLGRAGGAAGLLAGRPASARGAAKSAQCVSAAKNRRRKSAPSRRRISGASARIIPAPSRPPR